MATSGAPGLVSATHASGATARRLGAILAVSLSATLALLLTLAGIVVGLAPAFGTQTQPPTTVASYSYDWPGPLVNVWETDGTGSGISAPGLERPLAVEASPALIVGFGVAAETATAVGPDFIASSDGVIVGTSRSRMVQGFEDAGLPSVPTRAPGTQYTLPDGSLVRVMEPSGQAPLRASFTDSYGNPVNPFTGKQPQPPPGVGGAAWRQMMRDLTHVELGP